MNEWVARWKVFEGTKASGRGRVSGRTKKSVMSAYKLIVKVLTDAGYTVEGEICEYGGAQAVPAKSRKRIRA